LAETLLDILIPPSTQMKGDENLNLEVMYCETM